MSDKKKRRKRRRHRKHSFLRNAAAVLGVVVIAGLLVFGAYSLLNKDNAGENSTTSETDNLSDDAFASMDPIALGNQLYITKMGSYAGAYVEDGSDEIVTDVMMILLENQSENDLQYAEITVEFVSGSALFTVSNLPAGKSAVLLETSRAAWTEEEVVSTSVENLVFFESPMSVLENELKITGQDGSLTIENISGQDINVPMYVYYKNAINDMFYGGITYRIQLAEGIANGNAVQIATSHFDPDSSVVVAVTKME